MNKLEKVSIVKALDIDQAVKTSIDLIGGLDSLSNKLVLIKPNICNAKNPQGMVTTDFRLIKAVIDIVIENENDVLIVESDNISDTAENRIEKSGLQDCLDAWGINFFNLSHDDYEEYEVAGTALRLPKTVLDAEYFINLPKIKTCAHTLVTLGIKNLYGVLQRKQKAKLHKHLDQILPFLAETIRNDLILVDGINCMEGNGPVVGNPLCLNLVSAGRNIVSVDSVCSHLMGYDPSEIPHIALSSQRGVGPIDINNINVLGENLTEMQRFFEPPYSLKATIKSLKSIRDIYLD